MIDRTAVGQVVEVYAAAIEAEIAKCGRRGFQNGGRAQAGCGV